MTQLTFDDRGLPVELPISPLDADSIAPAIRAEVTG